MKTLKLYEGFIEEQQIVFNTKKDIIKRFIDLIDEYELPYLIIGQDINDYHYAEIIIKDNDYILVYENYDTKEQFKTKIFDVPLERLSELINYMGRHDILSVAAILEMYTDIKVFINILKKYKGKIENGNAWYFLEKVDEENDPNDEGNFTTMNSFKFQDLVLTNHPELIDGLIDAVNSEYNKGELDHKPLTPLKINEKAKKKHKKVFEDYKMRKNTGKYQI